MGTVEHLTQLQRAVILRARLFEVLSLKNGEWLRQIEQGLNDVLGEAQNAPPDGLRDGTLSEERFIECQRLVQAVRALRESAVYTVKRRW
jgi:hypothetical protein